MDDSPSRNRVSSKSEEAASSSVRSKSEANPAPRLTSCANLSRKSKLGSRRSSSSSRKSRRSGSRKGGQLTGRERCYDQPKRRVRESCVDNFVWDHGVYCRDECGSGIVPKRSDFAPSRKLWCKTPLSMYQATIGDLGRQILCREKVVPRDVKCAPPCNVCEYILPPCRGYYRKYDCLRPCEEEYATCKQGRKMYRDRVQRHWEPCLTKEQKNRLDINSYAGHNVYLGIRMRRKNVDMPCW